jgi:hypothetical protein
MARLKNLRNIAGGLLGSFVSRNNDFNGYWALGQLRDLAQNQGVSKLRITIRPNPPEDAAPIAKSIAARYGSMLDEQLASSNIPPSSVRSVSIDLHFEDGHAAAPYWGHPVSCRVTIVDLHDRVRSQHRYTTCRPHDPKHESRRYVPKGI